MKMLESFSVLAKWIVAIHAYDVDGTDTDTEIENHLVLMRPR